MSENTDIRINDGLKEFVIKERFVFENEQSGKYQIYIPDSDSSQALDMIEDFILSLHEAEYEDGINEHALVIEFNSSIILDSLIDFYSCNCDDNKIEVSLSGRDSFMRYKKSLEEQLKIIDSIEYAEEE
ncbi:TPA: hypothetical protein QB621_002203 [Pasteurella multocida]|uniref:hypothetical protein n=1 Tax=Pasteurella multocida TaxID=747 RepID=UPI00287A5DAF|nr:hypothetical protein [Pasteurella multocida]HDX1186906.1 hypothetical protein [Pasteurella multocida]HED4436877.1 hypothetical protein [Pasteurella multocida]